MNDSMPGPMPQRIPWWWYKTSNTSGTDLTSGDFSVASSGQHWIRAIDVAAAPDELFAWVTQLRRAPYSYDWIDNFGRHSPQTLDHTLVDVSVGDSVMSIFTVIEVVPGTSMTVAMKGGMPTLLFGPVTVHYRAEPRGAGSRLVVNLVVPRPPGPLATLRRYALAWGDLIMMRKQVIELKRLTELPTQAS
ncbi:MULTISPECIES: hypothetical protein [Kocuria]|uniref:Polyketide cyclase n=1 Tax=Kocuria subflava TaxID=1736139 RepID=A0A846TUS0_9MICC|nr:MULTISPECIES: hypothetical protein [Kocuria]NKE10800.1 hypothetical protein [Kocuria subflava]